jgi:hypothetical protein
MSSSSRIEARYPGECSCGAAVEPGDDIAWSGRVCGCLECEWTGERRPARADLVNVRGGGRGVAAGIRRSREKEARRRAREGRP